MKNQLLGLSLFASFFSLNTYAVISPESTAQDKAIIRLESPESINSCHGTIIGRNPLTVATSKICVLNNRFYANINGMSHTPTDASYAFYNSPEIDESKYADFAILIYKGVDVSSQISKSDLFKIETNAVKAGEKVSTCGFGSDARDISILKGSETQTCGSNILIKNSAVLTYEKEIEATRNGVTLFMEKAPKDLQNKITHNALQLFLSEFGDKTRIAIGSFERAETQDLESLKFNDKNSMTLLSVSDRGAPLFTSVNGEKKLIGIESVYVYVGYKNSSRIVGNIFWSLENEEVTSYVVEQAKQLGADL